MARRLTTYNGDSYSLRSELDVRPVSRESERVGCRVMEVVDLALYGNWRVFATVGLLSPFRNGYLLKFHHDYRCLTCCWWCPLWVAVLKAHDESSVGRLQLDTARGPAPNSSSPPPSQKPPRSRPQGTPQPSPSTPTGFTALEIPADERLLVPIRYRTLRL